MEWPPQNTGLFAPPSCATCHVVEPGAVNLTYLGGTPVTGCITNLSYSVAQHARDPETGVFAIVTVSWTSINFGYVGGCIGCYGNQCADDEGNPTGGGDYGYYFTSGSYTAYAVGYPEHGIGTAGIGAIGNCGWGGNYPDCDTQHSTEYRAIAHTFTW